MKARLIKRNEKIQLLTHNGSIKYLTPSEIMSFLKFYDDASYYSENTTWDYEVSIEAFSGETLVVVTDEWQLIIYEADFFRNIIMCNGTTYLTPSEYAQKYDKNEVVVRRRCVEGRIPGVIHKGKMWLIPEDAPFPKDARVGKRV